MKKSFLATIIFLSLAFADRLPAQIVPATAKSNTVATALDHTEPAVPVEPIAVIVAAFRSNAVVAIGNVEFRGNEQCHAFQMQLIRDLRFAAVTNDILVEFGNSRYQDVVDRFVRGEEVPYESLRHVWQDTSQVEYEWDLPIYEDFFRTVRALNASLPQTRQLRVLLGDPPVDWKNIHSLQDLRKAMGDRDGYALGVLRREVLAKDRRALVIYGTQHLTRRNTDPAAADEWSPGIIARLEKDHLASAFSILPETRRDLSRLQPDVTSWRVPSLAMLRGTVLGSARWDPDPKRRPVRIEEQFDAILYLGPPSSMTASRLAPTLCSDPAYMEMRLWRLSLLPPPPGATFAPADQLKDYCAHLGGYKEIPDRESALTERLRKVLEEAAHGKVNSDSLAPESRDRLTAFLERDGPRYLAQAGKLESLTLLEDSDSAGKRVRRYRSVFASGLKMMWTVGFSSAGTIVSLDPRPE